MEKIKIVNGISGMAWFGGWLFTIGYLKLAFWSGALALLIWPYDIGAALASGSRRSRKVSRAIPATTGR